MWRVSSLLPLLTTGGCRISPSVICVKELSLPSNRWRTWRSWRITTGNIWMRIERLGVVVLGVWLHLNDTETSILKAPAILLIMAATGLSVTVDFFLNWLIKWLFSWSFSKVTNNAVARRRNSQFMFKQNVYSAKSIPRNPLSTLAVQVFLLLKQISTSVLGVLASWTQLWLCTKIKGPTAFIYGGYLVCDFYINAFIGAQRHCNKNDGNTYLRTLEG